MLVQALWLLRDMEGLTMNSVIIPSAVLSNNRYVAANDVRLFNNGLCPTTLTTRAGGCHYKGKSVSGLALKTAKADRFCTV